MNQKLEKEISDVLTAKTVSAPELERLIETVENGVRASDVELLAAQADALDIKAATSRIEVATLSREHFRMLLSRLRQKQKEADWLIEHAEIERQRNAVAQELAEYYPEVEFKLVELLQRVEANNRKVA
jgi:hypothetical protein